MEIDSETSLKSFAEIFDEKLQVKDFQRVNKQF